MVFAGAYVACHVQVNLFHNEIYGRNKRKHLLTTGKGGWWAGERGRQGG